jgi:hypothetical protein
MSLFLHSAGKWLNLNSSPVMDGPICTLVNTQFLSEVLIQILARKLPREKSPKSLKNDLVKTS